MDLYEITMLHHHRLSVWVRIHIAVSFCVVCECHGEALQTQLAFPDSTLLIVLPYEAFMCSIHGHALLLLSGEALAGGSADLYRAHLAAD